MADIHRDQIDYEIANALSVEQMLLYLATVVQETPANHKSPGEYPMDVEAALRHGAFLAKKDRENWEHVRALTDAKTNGNAASE